MTHRLFQALRTLHIYLSLAGFALLLFFAVTGIVLVHSESWGLEVATTRTVTGSVPTSLVETGDRLALVERLRTLGAAGALETLETEGEALRLVFARPGSRTEATVSRQNGEATLAIESHGFSALLLDLHRGKQSGRWWIAIDVAGLLWVVSSLTGIVLWVQLRKRRALGALALFGGLVVSWVGYLFLAP